MIKFGDEINITFVAKESDGETCKGCDGYDDGAVCSALNTLTSYACTQGNIVFVRKEAAK